MIEIRVGVIGCGVIGLGHAKNLASGKIPGAKLTAVCDLSLECRAAAGEALGEKVSLFEQAAELMESNLVDAVIIASPHYQHPPLAIEAFQRGLHVLTEKPAGAYTKQARQMNEAAASGKDLVFAIMFQMRTDPIQQKIKNLIAKTKKKGHQFMDLENSLAFLKAGPIELCKYKAVKNIDRAIKAAREIGFPIVMKGSAPDLIHKTERGGVIIDIDNIEELVEAYEKLKPISEKIIVMEQVQGREVIASSIRDGVFGPSVMFGVGGVMVEAMNDVTFRVAPIGELDAEEMMDEIRGKALLGAFRGKKEADRRKIAQALKALGDVLIEFDEITDIEINPLFISEKGAIAVDCRVRVE